MNEETVDALSPHRAAELIALEETFGARNYRPLDVVIERGKGVWLYDVGGRRYLDCLAAYSAVNQGHCHPDIVQALVRQAERVTLTSRAFRNSELPLLLRDLCALTQMDAALLMNSGAEAVETAIKAARKWGYRVKGIPEGTAEVVVCAGGFHGRTITLVSSSSEAQYREGFGPLTPGFRIIPFGDVAALEAALTPSTCAFLVEPIQGEAGVIVPPDGYLRQAAELCARSNVLLLLDEIQSGLGRTGRVFAHQHDGVIPDGLILGKALSGGCYPVSAFLTRRAVMDVFTPGDHGSTYGGNPLGCAVARAALHVLERDRLADRASVNGAYFLDRLQTLRHPNIKQVRGRGLWLAIEFFTSARPYCQALMATGVLCKDTHDTVLRLAPPLVIEPHEIDWAFERIADVVAGGPSSRH